MKTFARVLVVFVVVGLALYSGGAFSTIFASVMPPQVEEWDEFEVFIEINATDGDAGLQGKMDGEPWRKARVEGPGGRKFFDFKPAANLRRHGVTEIQWESNEPPFSELPLDDFLALFPEGDYSAKAKTIENTRLFSEAELTHDLPAGPNITSLFDGQVIELDGNNVTVAWDEVTDDFRGGLLGSDVEGYIVVAEFEGEVMGAEIEQILTFELTADDLSADIPAEFLVADREYKIEVGAVEESGNTTFTEIVIETVDNVPN